MSAHADLQPLAGQTALVTGASRGIGRAIAEAYAVAGAHVFCAARSQNDLDATAAAIVERGGSAATVPLDVTDECSVSAAIEVVNTAGGSLDIAVLNAGVAPKAHTVVRSNPEDWQSTFAVNVFGVVACARHAAPLLAQGNGGKILVVGSGTGHQTNARLGAYAASKAAVASVVRTLALELREDAIAVNELVPGPVATAMTGFTEDGDEELPIVAQGTAEWFKQPADVTDLALLMAGFPNNGPSGQVFSLMGRLM